jgi:phosphoribosylglycinamide formyltransferase 1
MIRLAILASGSGTNAENMIRYFSGHALITVGVVLSNNRGAPVLAKAARHQVPSMVYPRHEWEAPSRIITHLMDQQIDYIVLAGFLLKIHPDIISSWPGKILNIHPALLPKYGGKGMYGEHVHRTVLENFDSESGITIHLVNEQYDQGRIVFQASCPVLPDDTPESLAKRVHELEYRHYPRVTEQFIFPGQGSPAVR